MSTELFGKAGGLLAVAGGVSAKLWALKPDQGADTAVWLAASPEVQGRNGFFWIERQERRCRFRDPNAEEALWKLCLDMTTA